MEKHLYFSGLTEKGQYMVMDDDFFDVTQDDVNRLIQPIKIFVVIPFSKPFESPGNGTALSIK